MQAKINTGGNENPHSDSFFSDSMQDFMKQMIFSLAGNFFFVPLDRVQVILQTQKGNTDIIVPYEGAFDIISRIISDQGIPALFRGATPSMITLLIEMVVKKIFSEIFPSDTSYSQNFDNLLQIMCLNVSKSVFSVLISYPFEVAATIYKADVNPTLKFKNFTDCMSQIYIKKSLKGLYQGWWLHAILEARLVVSSVLSEYTLSKYANDSSRMKAIMLPSLAFAATRTLTYPLQVVSRRLMVQTGNDNELYRDSMDCARKIYEKEGVSGFYAGFMFETLLTGVLLGSALVLNYYVTKAQQEL